MKPRHKRFALIGGGLAVLGIAAALVLNAFQSNLVFFFTPTQIAAGEAPKGKAFRIGGLVKEGSLKRQPDGLTVQFIVTDTAKEFPVAYTGILPSEVSSFSHWKKSLSMKASGGRSSASRALSTSSICEIYLTLSM